MVVKYPQANRLGFHDPYLQPLLKKNKLCIQFVCPTFTHKPASIVRCKIAPDYRQNIRSFIWNANLFLIIFAKHKLI